MQSAPDVPPAWRDPASSFATALADLRPVLPEAVLAGDGWARLVERAGDVPASAAETVFGFELRLEDPVPQADFCVNVLPGGATAEHYLRRGEGGEGAAAGTPAAAFAACVRDLEVLPDTRALVRWDHHVGAMLEYDVVGYGAAGAPPPGVFWRLVERACADGAERLAGFLAACAGRTVRQGESAELGRVLGVLGGFAGASHAGILPGRDIAAFRLLAHVPAGRLAVLLERLGWPGDIASAAIMAESLKPLAPHLAVAFDVTAAGLGERLGLELAHGRDWSGTCYADWRPLIDRLVGEGLAAPAKAAGLGRWCGFGRALHRKGVLDLYRGISHVKIVVGAGPVKAKAYLAAGLVRPRLARRRSEASG